MSGHPLVKALGAGIGLASEAIHHSRAKKAAARSGSNNEASGSGSGSNSPAQDGQRSLTASRSNSYNNDNNTTASPTAAAAVAAPPTYNAPRDESPVPPAYMSAEDEKRQLAEREQAEAESFGYLDDDEAIWELDDMAEYVDPPAYSESEGYAVGDEKGRSPGTSGTPGEALPEEEDEASEETPEEAAADEKVKKELRMVRELVRMAGPAPTPMRRIPLPVIIPQRRPGNKGRGFVRAYAPELADCGLGQDVFLRFLKDWYLASKASPWIDVVYVAAGIAGFVPSVAAQVTSIVVQVAAGAARELQSRHRNNTFLDRANQELFMPRGLFAMVMAFKDEMPGQTSGRGGLLGGLASALKQNVVSAERLDINQTAIKYSQLAATGKQYKRQNLRTKSGMTYTELELPEAAELVYPDLDRAAERDLAVVEGAQGAEGQAGGAASDKDKAATGNKWRGAGKFVSSYLDRRAQAAYEAEHAGSAVAVPADARKPFMSRYADPNHPASSGSLVALLTGGAVQGGSSRRGLGRERQGLLEGLRSGGLAQRLGSTYGRDDPNQYQDARYDQHGRYDPYGQYDQYGQYVQDAQRRRGGPYSLGAGGGGGLLGARRGEGGPIHAGVGLLVTGVNKLLDKRVPRGEGTGMASYIERRRQFSRQEEDEWEGRGFAAQPGQQDQYGQYQSSSNPPAPYGGSSNPPAPYGGSNPPAPYGGSSSNPPAPYGGSSSSYPSDRAPYAGGYNNVESSSSNTANYNNRINNNNNRGRGDRGLKKIMKQDVLYLLIVNLPTDEEVQASVAQLEQLSQVRQ